MPNKALQLAALGGYAPQGPQLNAEALGGREERHGAGQ
jgi:hypothetical protein